MNFTVENRTDEKFIFVVDGKDIECKKGAPIDVKGAEKFSAKFPELMKRKDAKDWGFCVDFDDFARGFDQYAEFMYSYPLNFENGNDKFIGVRCFAEKHGGLKKVICEMIPGRESNVWTKFG